MTNGELFKLIETKLETAGKEDSKFDAKCIFEDIMGLDSLNLSLHREETADEKKAAKAVELAEKRADGYPLQYLLGKWEFYGLDFKVGEGVLIPRPDTEILVETVLAHFAEKKHYDPEVIDLCSGSGCIAVSLKNSMPKAKVIAVEISSDAMPYLVENIRSNSVDVKILKGDVMDGRLLDNFRDEENEGDHRQLDCIVSNPPYLTAEEMADLQIEVTHEPASALDGGADGLKFYRVISCLWKEILKDGGLLAFEIGYRQGEDVADILRKGGFTDVKIIKDLGGNDRVVTGIKVNG
ncbi:MAG: peptide chain release factor N(5)-glutamine methyltransferase [Oscillospiraceae bacterium]|nr:peptide chain release factor N(5)-glutamine methyltransferase [Oscillospiraceae bacterium]